MEDVTFSRKVEVVPVRDKILGHAKAYLAASDEVPRHAAWGKIVDKKMKKEIANAKKKDKILTVTPDRLVVIGGCKIVVFKEGKGKLLVDQQGHLYDIRMVLSPSPDCVGVQFSASTLQFFFGVQEDTDGIIAAIYASTKKISKGIAHDKTKLKIVRDGTAHTELLPEMERDVKMGTLDGFVDAYKAVCIHQGRALDVHAKFVSHLIRFAAVPELCQTLDVTGHDIKNIDLRPLVQVMKLNEWFTSFKCVDVTCKEIPATVAAILKKNRTLRTVVLANNSAEKGWANLGELGSTADVCQLTYLDLSDNQIKDQGMKPMRAWIEKMHLEVLKLANCQLSAKGVERIVRAPEALSKLRILNLSGNKLGKSGTKSLVVFLVSEHAQSLQSLSLADCDVDIVGLCNALVEPCLSQLTALNISKNNLAKKMIVPTLASALNDHHVSEIDLSSTSLTADGLIQILGAMCSATRESDMKTVPRTAAVIIANDNALGRENGAAIAEVFQRGANNLHTIEVSDTGLEGDGLADLLAGLQHCLTLSRVACSRNSKFKEKNRPVVSELTKLVVRKNGLEQLVVQGNAEKYLGPMLNDLFDGIRAAKNLRLSSMDVAGNRIMDVGVECLKNMLRENRTIKRLNIDGNMSTIAGFAAFVEGVKSNPSLIEVSLPQRDLGIIKRSIEKEKQKLREHRLRQLQKMFEDLRQQLEENQLAASEAAKAKAKSQVDASTRILEKSASKPDQKALNGGAQQQVKASGPPVPAAGAAAASPPLTISEKIKVIYYTPDGDKEIARVVIAMFGSTSGLIAHIFESFDLVRRKTHVLTYRDRSNVDINFDENTPLSELMRCQCIELSIASGRMSMAVDNLATETAQFYTEERPMASTAVITDIPVQSPSTATVDDTAPAPVATPASPVTSPASPRTSTASPVAPASPRTSTASPATTAAFPTATAASPSPVAQQAATPAAAAPPAEEQEVLPPGWEARKTPGGKTYYMDHNTRTTQWTLPKKETAAAAAKPKVSMQEEMKMFDEAHPTAGPGRYKEAEKTAGEEGTPEALPKMEAVLTVGAGKDDVVEFAGVIKRRDGSEATLRFAYSGVDPLEDVVIVMPSGEQCAGQGYIEIEEDGEKSIELHTADGKWCYWGIFERDDTLVRGHYYKAKNLDDPKGDILLERVAEAGVETSAAQKVTKDNKDENGFAAAEPNATQTKITPEVPEEVLAFPRTGVQPVPSSFIDGGELEEDAAWIALDKRQRREKRTVRIARKDHIKSEKAKQLADLAEAKARAGQMGGGLRAVQTEKPVSMKAGTTNIGSDDDDETCPYCKALCGSVAGYQEHKITCNARTMHFERQKELLAVEEAEKASGKTGDVSAVEAQDEPSGTQQDDATKPGEGTGTPSAAAAKAEDAVVDAKQAEAAALMDTFFNASGDDVLDDLLPAAELGATPALAASADGGSEEAAGANEDSAPDAEAKAAKDDEEAEAAKEAEEVKAKEDITVASTSLVGGPPPPLTDLLPSAPVSIPPPLDEGPPVPGDDYSSVDSAALASLVDLDLDMEEGGALQIHSVDDEEDNELLFEGKVERVKTYVPTTEVQVVIDEVRDETSVPVHSDATDIALMRANGGSEQSGLSAGATGHDKRKSVDVTALEADSFEAFLAQMDNLIEEEDNIAIEGPATEVND